jgi:hypothetical protein
MRGLSYVGLALLLLGIVFVVVAEVNLQNVKSIVAPDGKSDDLVWYYACNLTSGNTYWIYIESNAAWGAAFTSGGFTTPQPVNVTIASPGGGVTSLLAFFYSVSPSSPYYREGTPPAIVEVTYENVDSSSLSVDVNSAEIRFSVEESGMYTVRVLDEGWIDTPPDFFVFYEDVPSASQTYTLLASGGGVLSIFGGVTVVVSVFRKKGAKRKRMRK